MLETYQKCYGNLTYQLAKIQGFETLYLNNHFS